MAAEIENLLRNTNRAIERFQEQMSTSNVSESHLSDLQVKIEHARNQLQTLMEKSPELQQMHVQLKKQLVDGIDRINRERLISMVMSSQSQVNLFMNSLKDFRQLLRRGERVEGIGRSEEQGY